MTTLEFSQKFEKALHTLFAFALKLTRNEEDARDLVQETACKAYANLDKFQPGTNFGGWLTTILRNTFISQYRQARRRELVNLPVEENLFQLESRASDNDALSLVRQNDLKRLLNSLEDIYRIPFSMFFEGYQYQEIAQAIQVPMGTVKSRIFYGRQQLQVLLKKHYS